MRSIIDTDSVIIYGYRICTRKEMLQFDRVMRYQTQHQVTAAVVAVVVVVVVVISILFCGYCLRKQSRCDNHGFKMLI